MTYENNVDSLINGGFWNTLSVDAKLLKEVSQDERIAV